MLHRTTLIAIPVAGLVVFGAAAGWWNYFDQRQQSQALAYQAEAQYNSSFHGLATDMRHLQEELGKSLVTSDSAAFNRRLRDVWRLTYAAQNDIARLPYGLMPMHHTQQFLYQLSEDVDTWSSNNADPKSPAVVKKLQGYFKESNQLAGQLEKLQSQQLSQNLKWSVVDKALSTTGKHKQDNQIIDGFKKMDTQAAVYEEANDNPTTTNRGRTNALGNEPEYNPRQAESALSQFLGVARKTPWNVTTSQQGAYTGEYNINGATPLGNVFAIVSKNGGHVLSFRIDHTPATRSEIDFIDAEKRAAQYLEARQFPKVQLQTANQFDGTGYFVFAPLFKGMPVTSQVIVVKVSLYDGVIIGYDATNYFYHPIKSVPSRDFTVAELRGRLNPQFRVGISKEVIVLDDKERYQPAVAFYGTSNRETYCVYMNAHTGKELTIDQLTNH